MDKNNPNKYYKVKHNKKLGALNNHDDFIILNNLIRGNFNLFKKAKRYKRI